MNGRSRRMTIGPYGALTVDRARDRAEKIRGLIADNKDPAQDKVDRNHQPTFGDLADMYLKRHAPRKRSADNDRAMIRRRLGIWKNRRLSSITRGEVARIHMKVGEETPYAANRLVALIRKMFNKGIEWEIHQGENPVIKIELFPEEKRERFIQNDELPLLMDSLCEELNPFLKTAFLVLLFTGARKTEVLTMKWEDLDLQASTWRIPHTKTGKPHLIPLAAPALALFQSLPPHMGNPYVFPGRSGQGHLVNITKAWKRIRERAGLPDIRIHDLRRTVGSWMAGAGVGLPIIGKVLNHTQPSTTAIYARVDIDPVRQVLEANAQKMIEVGNIVIEG